MVRMMYHPTENVNKNTEIIKNQIDTLKLKIAKSEIKIHCKGSIINLSRLKNKSVNLKMK